ncbi:ATP-grasp domain-containing protein [Cohnella faecalis]|uniref:ATP-grasp domain-containing protein n=1 Tax=Cohnella faecalis TaxID=2315694 RepID=A0A398CJQ5_9BACL|nr:ATP-grasp domain-containing protein [Cohnella faecalis]RIE02933.1 ATP-grasp domain-containing protein [Cohnella faecalis]
MTIEHFSDDIRLTILLTGGRAPVTLELARSFHSAGHRVLVAESARYHLCRVSRAVERSFQVPPPNENTKSYLDAIESIVTSERVDVIIPTCEEIFFIAKGLDRLRRHCTVWAAPTEQLGELHDKWRFVLLAERLGLTTPQSKLIRTREEWQALAEAERLNDDLVLKPAYSRFASQVLFLAKEHSHAKRRQVLSNIISAAVPKTPWIAQRHVYGRHICTYSVAYEGDLIAHAAYPCQYRVGQGATVYFKPLEHKAAQKWVRKLVKAIRFTGQIAFDFIEEEDGGLYALECNPRATSGVHLFGEDGGLVQAFLRPQELRESGAVLTPKPSNGAMLAPAMFASGIGGIRSFRELRSWHQAFRSARDVVFSRKDMQPSVEQLRVLIDAWRTSRARGIKLVHATTIDIEWNGDA